MDRRRLKEWGKNLLIVALAVNAVWLSGALGLAQNYLGGDSRPQIAVQGDSELKETGQAARPLTMVISAAENAHHGVKYDGDALSEVYSWFTASLGEALGSSGEPEEVTQAEWEAALRGQGVFFDYLYDQSMSTLARWLGTEISSGASLHTARRFCLAVEDGAVALYYIRAATGAAYRCDTAVNAGRFTERLDGYAPNAAVFGFELGGQYPGLDPYYVMLSSLPEVPSLTASNPLAGSDGAELLELFGINELAVSRYTENDGTQVYIDGDKSLRLSPDGTLEFSAPAGAESGSAPEAGTGAVISRAHALAQALPSGGVGELQLSLIAYDRDKGEYTVRFDYAADGIVVCHSDRAAAMEFRFDGAGELIGADVLCRSYAETGSQTPLPERQALVLVSQSGGGEPMLAYADTGAEITLTWVIKR